MKFTMNSKLLILLTLSVGLFTTACSQNKKKQTETVLATIKPADFKQKLDGGQAVLIDVRTPGERKKGFIAGSRHLDLFRDDFEAEINKLDTNATYLVYCAIGGRSLETAEMMNKKGFKAVYDLDGGIEAWKKAGYSIVTE